MDKAKKEELNSLLSSLYGYIVGLAMATPNGKSVIEMAQADLNRVREILEEECKD